MASCLDRIDPISLKHTIGSRALDFENSTFLHSLNYDSEDTFMKPLQESYLASPKLHNNIPHVGVYKQSSYASNHLNQNNNLQQPKRIPIVSPGSTKMIIDSDILNEDTSLKLEDISDIPRFPPSKKFAKELANNQWKYDSMHKPTVQRTNNEYMDIKLFYQKKIAELELIIEHRDQTISSLRIKLNERIDGCHCNIEEPFSKSFNLRKNRSRGKEDVDDKNNPLNRSHYENVEKLVADNERNILKAKEMLMNENKILKENTIKLTENLKITDEMEDTERNRCLAQQEEFHQMVKNLQNEISEKTQKISFLEMENSQLNSEKQKLEGKFNDMKNDTLETSTAIANLQSKINEYKSAMVNLDNDKQYELIESEKRNKDKLLQLESSMMDQLTKQSLEAKQTIELLKKEAEESMSEKTYRLMESEKRNKKKLVHLESSMMGQLTKQSLEAKQTMEFIKNKTEEILTKMFLKFSNRLDILQKALAVLQEKVKVQKVNVSVCFNRQQSKFKMMHLEYKSHMEASLSKLQQRYNLDVTEYSEQLGRQKREYEEKLKGVLPLYAKIELEDTIESLRQQIIVLQSKNDLIQEELDGFTMQYLS